VNKKWTHEISNFAADEPNVINKADFIDRKCCVDESKPHEYLWRGHWFRTYLFVEGKGSQSIWFKKVRLRKVGAVRYYRIASNTIPGNKAYITREQVISIEEKAFKKGYRACLIDIKERCRAT
jgi:hypothetical protein